MYRRHTLLLGLFFLTMGLEIASAQTDVQTTSTGTVALVDVRSAITPAPLEEIRYATKYNFAKTQFYSIAAAFLHPDTAQALARVQRDLEHHGLGLKIYDAYRPLSVQQKMWDLIRDKRYVSNPAIHKGLHTRGTAVDVTIVDEHGNELSMPSHFDDFTEKAHRGYQGATPEQKKNQQTLEEVMVRHGFLPNPYEWWHFDFHDWKNAEKYPVLDVPLDLLSSGNRRPQG